MLKNENTKDKQEHFELLVFNFTHCKPIYTG